MIDTAGTIMKSTIKVFHVLETLCEGNAAGVTELSNQLDIKPSSVHRFLSVLRGMGYVDKNESTGKYYATMKVSRLGTAVKSKTSLLAVARPHMEALCESLLETVNIAVFAQNNVVVIDRVQSAETLRTYIVVGRHLPAYCTAFGKIFLSFMPPASFVKYLAEVTLEPLTDRTITDHKALALELEKVRRRGYSIDNQELDDNVRCIAAPIWDDTAQLVAALSVSAPVNRFKMVRIKSIAKTLLNASAAISARLGYSARNDGN